MNSPLKQLTRDLTDSLYAETSQLTITQFATLLLESANNCRHELARGDGRHDIADTYDDESSPCHVTSMMDPFIGASIAAGPCVRSAPHLRSLPLVVSHRRRSHMSIGSTSCSSVINGPSIP